MLENSNHVETEKDEKEIHERIEKLLTDIEKATPREGFELSIQLEEKVTELTRIKKK